MRTPRRKTTRMDGPPANNRLQPPYQYDASGNMTADATHTYFYDAESRLIQVGGTLGNCSTATACYVYDAEGQRLEKLTGGTTTAYLRNSKGEVVAETDGGNTLLRAGYVYAGGELLAEYENGTTNFVLKDHLGDTRVMTTYSTTAAQDAQVYDSMDYLPYGEQIAGGTGTTHKFTGKERDAESGLDDFDARYYSSNLGRFVSADWSAIPVAVPYADFNDAQSLNLYTYVRNLPTVSVDPNGHSLWDVISKYVDSVYAKASAGIGLEVGFKVGGVQATVGASATYNVESSGDNTIQTSRSYEVSATAKLPGTPAVGVSAEVSQVTSTLHREGNEITGKEQPTATVTSSLSKNSKSASASSDGKAGVGVDIGGLKGEIGIDKNKLQQANQAAAKDPQTQILGALIKSMIGAITGKTPKQGPNGGA